MYRTLNDADYEHVFQRPREDTHSYASSRQATLSDVVLDINPDVQMDIHDPDLSFDPVADQQGAPLDVPLGDQSTSVASPSSSAAVTVVNGDEQTRDPVLRLLIALYMWSLTFRISRATFKALLLILAYFCLFFTGNTEVFTTLHRLDVKLSLGRKNDDEYFQTFVTCPKCFSIYKMAELASPQQRQCSYVKYPRHPHQTKRLPCGTPLVDVQRAHSDRKSAPLFKPRVPFPYSSIVERLQELLLTPNFRTQCESWRTRDKIPGHFSDIYDGYVIVHMLSCFHVRVVRLGRCGTR